MIVDMNFNPIFVDACNRVTLNSDDPHRKVGCVITKGDEIIVEGANKLPHGIKANPNRLERPNKYMWIEHAERTAIYKAAQSGIPLENTTMYLNWWPCVDCCRAIINSGIKKLVVPNRPDFEDEKWGAQFIVTSEMINEVDIDVVYTNDA